MSSAEDKKHSGGSTESSKEERKEDEIMKAQMSALSALSLNLVISNPLVLLIGISRFQSQKKLPGVEKDMQNMKHLFVNLLHYDCLSISEVINNQNQMYSMKDVQRFINKSKAQINNVFEGNKDINKDKYDGLIVVISTHGTDGYMCTSYNSYILSVRLKKRTCFLFTQTFRLRKQKQTRNWSCIFSSSHLPKAVVLNWRNSQRYFYWICAEEI